MRLKFDAFRSFSRLACAGTSDHYHSTICELKRTQAYFIALNKHYCIHDAAHTAITM